MSEEKRLDEKALEEVSGGSIQSEYDSFRRVNCLMCGHYFNQTCPYGSTFDAMADAIQGRSERTKLCPKKVARK